MINNKNPLFSAENKFEKLVVKPPNEIPLPPMPTAAPEFIPIAERLSPEVLAELKLLNKVSLLYLSILWYKISNNNAQVTVHLLIIVISWFAGLSAWSSKKVMNLTERGESFSTMG
mgnify:CR=1 FL=1